MTTYCTSEAARRTGLPTSTLRYNERIGLLPAPPRTSAIAIEFVATARRRGA